jgi:hypothetical protein
MNMSKLTNEPRLGQDKILIEDKKGKNKMIVFKEFEEEGDNIITEEKEIEDKKQEDNKQGNDLHIKKEKTI